MQTLLSFVPLLLEHFERSRPLLDRTLGLSYAETVGAVHQIWKAKHLQGADFKAENDRILAAIIRQERQIEAPERSNFSTPGGQDLGPPAAPTDADTSLGGRN